MGVRSFGHLSQAQIYPVTFLGQSDGLWQEAECDLEPVVRFTGPGRQLWAVATSAIPSVWANSVEKFVIEVARDV